VQLQDENPGSNDEEISPASQSTQHAPETADGSTANHTFSEAKKADPWKRKTLLTLGAVAM